MINQKHFFEGFYKSLVKVGEIHLPDFGVFRNSYRSASIDAIEGKIIPPSKEVFFSHLESTDQNGLELIAKELSISMEDVDSFYKQLKSSWTERLLNKEIIQLDHFGRIYKEFSGEVKFKQELNSSLFDNNELPVLNFRPITRTARSKELIETVKSQKQKSSISPSRKKKNIFSLLTKAELLPITIGVASFLLILGMYLILPQQPNFSNQSLAEKVKVERINKKPSHQLEAELAKDTFLDQLQSEQDLEDEVSAVLENGTNDSSELTISPPPSKRISPKKLRQAIIITGAYQNINGAKRKIRSLVAKGYNPYQDVKRDLHRVGITFSYREAAELQENLLQIQETISPQAWILE